MIPRMKQPRNPIPKDYIPPGGTRYPVKTNDDWGSIALAHNVATKDLIMFNFGTFDKDEINWYLHHKVGCRKATRDGHNWMFTTDAYPGIIYIPSKTWNRPSFPPHPPVPEPEAPKKRSGIWFGIGFQTGGHFFIGGKDTVEACIYSLESYNDRFWMNIDGLRVGPGLGGSIGAVLVMISHCHTPSDIQNLSVGGWDVQANVVGKWSDLAKSVKALNTVQKFAKLGSAVDKTMTVLEYNKVREAIILANKLDSVATNALKQSKPAVDVVGIPFAGVGLEVSVFYGWGSVFVHGVTLESGYAN